MSNRSGLLLGATLIAGIASMAVLGCSDTSESLPAIEGIDLSDPETRIYEVAGVVASLPDPDRPASEFQIRHEAIPDFVGPGGDVVGMNEMTMPFPLAEGVSVEGFSVGDAVQFKFAVNYGSQATRPWELIEITRAIPSPTPEEAPGVLDAER